ncbi:MAG: SoxR reducing system RseC family protein [Pseudomonadota bacterium]
MDSCSGTGVVDRVLPDGRAVVRVSRNEACMACESKAACQSFGGQIKEQVVVIKDPPLVQPGQVVRLQLPETSLLTSTALLYSVPALLLLGGAILGAWLGPMAGLARDPGSALGAGAGLLLGLLAAGVMGRRLGRNPAYQPRIVGTTGRGSG